MNKIFFSQRAFGIVAAVIIMLIVSVLALTVVSLLGTNTAGALNYMHSQQAFYLAESGIQRALLALKNNDWTGWSGSDPKTIQATLTGYGDYDVSVVGPTGDDPIITAMGYRPSRTTSGRSVRVITITAHKTNIFGTYAAFGGGSGGGSSVGASLTGGAYSDSYDSSLGLYNVAGNIGSNGDIGTNADITVSGGGTINGDAITGPSGTFNNAAAVTGSISHDANVTLSAVVVPASLTSLGSSGNITSTTSIAPGDYKYGQFKLASSETITITGPANIYLTSSTSIQMTASSKITISSSSTGPVVIYADGDVLAAGQGIENSTLLPSNFQLYGSKSSPTQNIKVTGGNSLYSVIYAPNGDLTINGVANVYGSFIGDTLTMTGSSGLHHDESLDSLPSQPSFISDWYVIQDWQESY